MIQNNICTKYIMRLNITYVYVPYHSPINTEQSSRSISSSDISASTLYNHARVGLPTGLLASPLYSIFFLIQFSSLFLITCSYHLSPPLLITVVIGWTPTDSQFFTCPSVFHGNTTHPSNHLLYICVSNIYTFCVLVETSYLCMSVSV